MNTDYSKCWANYRRDCDRGMSDEHLLSKALFPQQAVYVSGFDWCGAAEKKIGINSLQRRFLCEKHNNALSPADTEAVEALSAFASGESQREINGGLLERWLLKSAINLSIGTKSHIGCGMSESVPGWPSPYLLAVAFGDLSFSHNMGAYFFDCAAEYRYRAGEILMTPLLLETGIGGFLFGLRGAFVFLNLVPGDAPSNLLDIPSDVLPPPLNTSKLIFRPGSLTIRGSNKESRINFAWPA